jgi:hypothetical protein
MTEAGMVATELLLKEIPARSIIIRLLNIRVLGRALKVAPGGCDVAVVSKEMWLWTAFDARRLVSGTSNLNVSSCSRASPRSLMSLMSSPTRLYSKRQAIMSAWRFLFSSRRSLVWSCSGSSMSMSRSASSMHCSAFAGRDSLKSESNCRVWMRVKSGTRASVMRSKQRLRHQP